MNNGDIREKIAFPDYDVVVAGAGLAGVAAAIAAAREGMRVLVVERYGFAGGMATSALVNPFMNYFESGANGKLVNKGLFETFRKDMQALGATKYAEKRGCHAFNDELLKIVLDREMAKNGVDVLYHALLSDVSVKDGKINFVTVSTISGNFDLKAKFFIDATGNADLTAFAGLEFKLGRENDNRVQPMTLCFRLSGVDESKLDVRLINEKYAQMRREGRIRNKREDVLLFNFRDVDCGEGLIHFNTTRILEKNPVSALDRSAAEIEAREQVLEMVEFLKNNFECMKNAYLVNMAAETGIRESRRIVGMYEITASDIVNARKFDDSIARGSYEIDIHSPDGTGTHHVRLKEGEYYTIPYRAMVPVAAVNLLAAGRPLSSTHEAHAAFRVMPITTCIGEAAGVAAALAVKKGVSAALVPVPELREKLVGYGALI